jgi:hypothetical protein
MKQSITIGKFTISVDDNELCIELSNHQIYNTQYNNSLSTFITELNEDYVKELFHRIIEPMKDKHEKTFFNKVSNSRTPKQDYFNMIEKSLNQLCCDKSNLFDNCILKCDSTIIYLDDIDNDDVVINGIISKELLINGNRKTKKSLVIEDCQIKSIKVVNTYCDNFSIKVKSLKELIRLNKFVFDNATIIEIDKSKLLNFSISGYCKVLISRCVISSNSNELLTLHSAEESLFIDCRFTQLLIADSLSKYANQHNKFINCEILGFNDGHINLNYFDNCSIIIKQIELELVIFNHCVFKQCGLQFDDKLVVHNNSFFISESI